MSKNLQTGQYMCHCRTEILGGPRKITARMTPDRIWHHRDECNTIRPQDRHNVKGSKATQEYLKSISECTPACNEMHTYEKGCWYHTEDTEPTMQNTTVWEPATGETTKLPGVAIPSGFVVKPTVDMVNHPPHYKSPARCKNCGASIECIQISRHLPFNLGNALKYIWRAGFGGKKNVDPVEDLQKAVWYLNDEITECVERESLKEEDQ